MWLVLKSTVFSDVIVDVIVSRRSFVFDQSYVAVPTSLSDVGGLSFGALDLSNCSLSVVRVVLSLTLVSKCRGVAIGLWASRKL